MLQAIRSRASGIVVQILFGVLILTFSLWGIGDIFRNRGSELTVATVGGQKIPQEEISRALQAQVERLRQAMNGSLTSEQIKELGIADSVLQQLIDQHLVDLEANRLGVAIGNDSVRQAILANPSFLDNGRFDRNRYLALLQANQMNEAQFESLLRSDLIRRQIIEPMTAGAAAPAVLVDALLASRGERRVAEAVLLPANAVGNVDAPDDKTLNNFYDQHQDQFRAPERRAFTVATLSPAQIAGGIKIPEETLEAEYKARGDEFREPERRELQQILVPDEAKAKAAEDALKSGKDFAAVAHDVAGETPDAMNLGSLKRDDFPSPDLAAAVFALTPGEVSAPVKTSFGWHILRLVSVKPEEVQPFEKAKDKLAADLANAQAADEIAKTANAIDDALAGGAKFPEIVQKFALKTAKVEDVDSSGHDPAGKELELPGSGVAILQTAFATPAGQTSDLKDAQDQGYYLVSVDKVTPATVPPLAQIRDKVVAQWQESERQARLAKLGQDIANAVNGGQSLDDVAALHGLKPFATAPLVRTASDKQIPPALVAKLFAAKRGEAVTAPAEGDTGAVVALVKDVLPTDPAQASAQKTAIAREVEQAMRGDIMSEFSQALRKRYPVSIDQAALDRLL
jgi:peptidyl-prolyl cis-trans isomerase D